jgi:hypothetical protein
MKPLSRKLLLTLGRLLLFVGLLILPTLVRGLYFYRRIYVPGSVPRPDHTAVEVPTVAAAAFADEEVPQGGGLVIVDRAHENSVDDADLTVLLARLTARGAEAISLVPGDSLPQRLRDAAALVVIAPHQSFTPGEVRAVERFVARGGRVLLVADPSRYVLRAEYDPAYGEYTVPQSDATAINSLAAPFGLSFADDYIYNTAENAGNYQYVILKDFTPSPLTDGLDEVIFYAAHSISTGQTPLITGDDRTTSSLSQQSGGLVAVSLGNNDRVLAVSDFTFMTEPYNSSADNDRLLANIAGFLAGAERVYTLADFPHAFGDQADLIPLTGPAPHDALPAQVVERGHDLQSAFAAADKTLRWRAAPQPGHDAVYLGLYGSIDFEAEVGQILARRGISFTLETVEREQATPTPTGEATRRVTPAGTPSATPTERPLRDWIRIAGMGQIEAKEIALFYQNEEAGRQVLLVLAFTEDGLDAAVQRLIYNDFTRCVVEADVAGDPDAIDLALCPTDYEPSPEEPPATPTPSVEEPEATPTPAPEGGILIVADDDGTGAYEWWTSAYLFEEIAVQLGYPATVWSTYLDGEVTPEQMQAHDAVIWCTGDYQEDASIPAEEDLLAIAEYVGGGGRLILSGAFLGVAGGSESGLLVDIQVAQADHPLAAGFESEQVISLQRFTAEEDYNTYVLDETDPEAVVFARGPESEFSGAPAIAAGTEEFSGGKTVVIGFPLYLVPWEEQSLLGGNAVLWLMEEVEP